MGKNNPALSVLLVLNATKEVWEAFSNTPIIIGILDMLNIDSTSRFLDFFSRYWLLIVSIVWLVILYVPLIFRRFTGLSQVTGQKFSNKTILLDGKQYIGCVFQDCTLRWNGDDFKVNKCEYIGRIGIESQNDEVVRTVDLLKALGHLEKEFSEAWRHLPKEHFE